MLHLLHCLNLYYLVLINPKLLPSFQNELVTTSYFLYWENTHVTVGVTWQPKMHSHRLGSLSLTRLGHTNNMFTKSSFKTSPCAPNVLGTTNLSTLATRLTTFVTDVF